MLKYIYLNIEGDYMGKKVIIFDLDGTLYQTHITSVIATKKAFEDFGIEIPSEEKIISYFGDTMESFCHGLAPNLDDSMKKELGDRVSHYEKEYIENQGKLFDGVEEMLKELKNLGYILAISSNGRREYIDKVLSSCNIKKYFKLIKGREENKSKGDLVKEILKKNNWDCGIVIGDRLSDMESARDNSLLSIGASYGYGGNEVSCFDFVANNTGDILSHTLRLDIFNSIEKNIRDNKGDKAYILGVNGVDTCGKTTFSKLLDIYLRAKGYKTCLIHIDDFHNPSAIRTQGDNPIDSYIDYAFNLNLLEDELLRLINNGYEINKTLNLLDLDKDTFTNQIQYKIDKDTVVILEGVLLYRYPINQYFDSRIFLDITFEEVLKRAEIRDVPKYGKDFLNKYKTKYIPIQEKYLEKFYPKERCDFLIENTNFERPQLMKWRK